MYELIVDGAEGLYIGEREYLQVLKDELEEKGYRCILQELACVAPTIRDTF